MVDLNNYRGHQKPNVLLGVNKLYDLCTRFAQDVFC